MTAMTEREIRTAEIEDEVSEKGDGWGNARSRKGDETREGDGNDEDRVRHLNIERPLSGQE